MNRKIAISTAVAALVAAASAGLAFAKQAGNTENDAVVDLAKVKITLAQAVGTAETKAGGKATRAKLDDENGAVVFNVEVVASDSKVFDVKVDAADGKVLSSKPDHLDREREENDD